MLNFQIKLIFIVKNIFLKMNINITENQYNNLILNEAENIAYNRSNAKEPNLKAIWAAIDSKQKMLQQEVFGELSEKIYDITIEKMPLPVPGRGLPLRA